MRYGKAVRISYFSRIPGILFALVVSNTCGVGNAEPSAEADFRISCSSCHGEDGRGEGAKVFGLSAEPPDLTTLSRRNDGVFPRERLRRIIDGRDDIKVHGDREMPVWGQLFKLDAEDGLGGAEGDETAVERRIEALIDFIESLQN
jgi:hypothetical protein